METRVSSASRTAVISPAHPTVLIGERINPTGRRKLAAALQEGDLEPVRRAALAQMEAGADILDVNVGADGVDEVAVLPQAVRLVMETVDAPVCIDSTDPEALRVALEMHRRLAPEAKPIVNSVNGEERSLSRILPLIKEYGAAVIGLTMDERGIPTEPGQRLAIARKIMERAASLGISREEVIIDPLSLSVGTDQQAAVTTLEAVRLVRAELGLNMTLGASNVSFGLPERGIINSTFLTMAITAGVTCPIVDAAKVRFLVLTVDLLLGRDEYALRYIKAYRERQRAHQ